MTQAMTQTVRVYFCALFALIAAMSLLKAWRSGTIGSRGWTFE